MSNVKTLPSICCLVQVFGGCFEVFIVSTVQYTVRSIAYTLAYYVLVRLRTPGIYPGDGTHTHRALIYL